MSFSPVWTKEAAKAYHDLRAKAESSLEARRRSKRRKSPRAEGLFKQLRKCIDLLLQNPRHPGLHTHEFSSMTNPYDKDEKVFEAYAQHGTPAAYRVFWCYGPDRGQITILAKTSHP